MKKLVTLFAITAVVLVFANCSSTKPAASPEKATAEATIADLKAKYSETQMLEGKTVWETKCVKCHKLFQPGERNVAQWEGILPRMFKRANLDENQAGNVRAYIISHSKAS